MSDQPQSLRQLYTIAEQHRKQLESAFSTTSIEFQENLSSAILAYEQCLASVDRISLFSPNETLDDISTSDLPFLLLNHHLAELTLKLTSGDRKSNLLRAQQRYERFLKLLEDYEVLSKDDVRMFERYTESRARFSTATTSDAAARRETKIARFKAEKELKNKLQYLQENPSVLQNDEAIARDLHLTNIALCVHQTFASLESVAVELQILRMAPPASSIQANGHDDPRQQAKDTNGYSERLDGPISAGLRGPILDKDGRPLRPFTLLDNRQRMQQGVFRPDHSLPTMTIDEYLEEERKRGGMIDGGGPQSAVQPEPDEDDMDKADEETMKKRAWDEFVEENPKGSGNTINRG